MLESPKKRFMHNKDDVQWHLDLVNNPRFLKAVDAALLSMMNGQPGDGNEANAASVTTCWQGPLNSFASSALYPYLQNP